MATVITEDLEHEVELTMVDANERREIVNDQILEDFPLGAIGIWIASSLTIRMGYHAHVNQLGRVITENLFILERSPRLWRKPDVAFVSRERWPLTRQVPDEAAWDVIPDLAVEVVSPNDQIHDLMDKVEDYFRVGVRLLWVVYPRHHKVYVYESPETVQILGLADTLDGGNMLPGFRLPLTSVFEISQEKVVPEG